MPLLGTLFTLPDAPTMLTNIGSTSAPIFTDFLPAVELILGIVLAIFVVQFLIHALHRYFQK